MKKVMIFVLAMSVTLMILNIVTGVRGNYQYSKKFGSYWSLAEKASSIEKKIEWIDKFVAALESSGLEGQYDAIFLETPDNSFDENMSALKSLQTRLHEIKQMDIKSFEYQTALQQITQQEQAEAGEMLGVFRGIWWKENHIMLWGWIAVTQFLILLFFIVTSLLMMTDFD